MPEDLQPVVVDPVVSAPAPAPVAVEPAAPAAPALNIDDEASVDATLADGAITPPDGEALIPSGNVGKVARAYRQQLKEVKAKLAEAEPLGAKAQQLEQRVLELTQAVEQMRPYVEAYQQQAPPAAQAAAADEIPAAQAESWARRYQLYKADGSGQLDIATAADILRDQRAMMREEATRAAAAAVQPLAQQTVQQQSAYMLSRAKNTTLPNGTKADPALLEQMWNRVDPSLTATREGAIELLMAAIGRTYGMMTADQLASTLPPRGPDGKFVTRPAAGPAAPIMADPIPREPAGGFEAPTAALSEQERRFLQQSGMTEADYLKSAQTAPWLRK